MLKSFHYFAGAVLALFVFAHLGNHLVGLIGIDNHIATMEILRKVYRNVVVEFLLILVLIIQVISGLRLAWAKRSAAQDKWVLLQIVSGAYLLFFLVVHVSAVMFGRFWLKLDTNAYFAMAGLNTEGYRLFFIPYYALSVFFFFGHIAAIHRQKMSRAVVGVRVAAQSVSIVIFGTFVAAAIIFSMMDGFSTAGFPEAYKVLTP